jgi:lipopolysaccharide/colanic/teichoic acid biosynthesis glycosyltransferase
VIKRVFDIVVSALGLLLLSPVLLVIAVASRISMGPGVLFRQQRPGRDGGVFTMYKFRTMSDAVDTSGEPLQDAERMTSFGSFLRRSSLDELPEFFNVVRGDMSLVGPRPLLVDYLPLYTPEQARRHAVRPGITGWAQVNGRNAISWEKKFDLDVWYVDNRSLMLDLKILLKTVAIALGRKGISQQGHVTAEPFAGSTKKDGTSAADR